MFEHAGPATIVFEVRTRDGLVRALQYESAARRYMHTICWRPRLRV